MSCRGVVLIQLRLDGSACDPVIHEVALVDGMRAFLVYANLGSSAVWSCLVSVNCTVDIYPAVTNFFSVVDADCERTSNFRRMGRRECFVFV